MGVEYYLMDNARKEVFLLGKGDWNKVFDFGEQDGDGVALPDLYFIDRLRDFLRGRRVSLGSDAADIGSVAVPVTIVGSRYDSDAPRIGTKMNLWPYDHERDGWCA